MGVKGAVDGRTVVLGNRALMDAEGADVAAMMDAADALRSEGKTAMFVAVDGKAAGVIAVADPIKSTTPDAIKALHEVGLTSIMATGENERTARAGAAKRGIDEVRADVLPADKKALIDEKIAEAQDEYGLLLVHTGNGKGKSSSAFGMVARALGHGIKVGVVQFIKGAARTGEEAFFRRFPDEVRYHGMGEGFTWETQDRQRDIAKAREAWTVAAELLADPEIGLVVLDELNIALKYGYLELAPVFADVESPAPLQHGVVTGRGAPPGLVEAAGHVTQVALVKQAFNAGLKAQKRGGF